MPVNSFVPPVSNRALSAWWRNALTMWEISLAAPQVIAHRTGRMARAGALPGARDRLEFTRMGQEKAEAYIEAMLAMGPRLLQAQTAMAMALFGQWLRSAHAVPRVLASGLKPVHRRVTANARRLARG